MGGEGDVEDFIKGYFKGERDGMLKLLEVWK